MDTHKINIEKNLQQLEELSIAQSNRIQELIKELADNNEKKTIMIEKLGQISANVNAYIDLIKTEQAKLVKTIAEEKEKHKKSFFGWWNLTEFPDILSTQSQRMIASSKEIRDYIINLIEELKQSSTSGGRSRRRKSKRSSKRSSRKMSKRSSSSIKQLL